MSEHDAADHVEDETVGAVKVAVAAGASAGIQMARLRQDRARRAQEESAASARLDAQRREALWLDSRSELQPIMQDQWWDGATPEDIGRAYATATAWEGRDEVAPYAERLREQVRSRYGVDLDQVRPDDVAGELNLRDADRERSTGDQERAEAERLMKEADQAEAPEREEQPGESPNRDEKQHDEARAAEQDGRTMYDSAERREALAEDLMGRGVPVDAAEARVRADAGQAAPASDAAREGRRVPKARKGKGTQAGQQRDRSRQR